MWLSWTNAKASGNKENPEAQVWAFKAIYIALATDEKWILDFDNILPQMVLGWTGDKEYKGPTQQH